MIKTENKEAILLSQNERDSTHSTLRFNFLSKNEKFISPFNEAICRGESYNGDAKYKHNTFGVLFPATSAVTWRSTNGYTVDNATYYPVYPDIGTQGNYTYFHKYNFSMTTQVKELNTYETESTVTAYQGLIFRNGTSTDTDKLYFGAIYSTTADIPDSVKFKLCVKGTAGTVVSALQSPLYTLDAMVYNEDVTMQSHKIENLTNDNNANFYCFTGQCDLSFNNQQNLAITPPMLLCSDSDIRTSMSAESMYLYLKH